MHTDAKPFSWTSEPLNKKEIKCKVYGSDGSPLTYADFLHLCKSDSCFRDSFIECLEHVPYEAYYWEVVPTSKFISQKQVFEFVVTKTSFSQPTSFLSFEAKFQDTSSRFVATFLNLGGDALLVAPCPSDWNSPLDYGHMETFLRHAPMDSKHALWIQVAKEMESLLDQRRDSKVWLSTNGQGVPWLHIRLDSWPKYYLHTPYREA